MGENVVNLSGHPISADELSVLDKGLKYAPANNLNKFDTYIGILKYIRKVNVKKYYLSNPYNTINTTRNNTTMVTHSTLRNNSVFNPQVSDNQHIEVFKKLVLKDLESLEIKKLSDPIHIKNGIKSLKERKDTIVRPADKGGAIVIQSKEQYQNEIRRQLQDESTYIKFLGNPTNKYKSVRTSD